jgi:hypothetical protein
MRAPAIVASPSPVLAPAPPPGTITSPGNSGSTTDVAGSGGTVPSPAAQRTTADPPIDQPAEDSPDDIEAPLDWQAFVPTDTADHLATMDRAARDSGCGVPWHLLAAIARVESDFGRNMATSSAGAMGYGQFLPSSWHSFGNDGNVYDYRDALPAIATYLCQSGLERDPRAALFAYNHADWYVDMVLDLAVRYDRMAPGAPTPDVLEVGPAAESGTQMHYAAGRDVRRESRRRTLVGQADWLGIPWRGRAPGASISASTIESTTLAMVRGAFRLTSTLPQPTEAGRAIGLTSFANRAWAGGLLAVPIEPPVQLPGPDELRPAQNALWSLAEIRRSIERGQPLVAVVNAPMLPGHSAVEGIADQPVVLIGTTPTGLVFSDPSFSSSLGYGLELSDAEFLRTWQAASTPGQALAFSLRPAPPMRDAHVRAVEAPPVYARVAATAEPPAPELTSAPLPDARATEAGAVAPAMALQAAAAGLGTEPGAAAPAAADNAAPATRPAAGDGDDRSWVIVLVAGAALLAALLVRRGRARRSV